MPGTDRKQVIIACQTVLSELAPLLPEEGCLAVEPGLHLHPDKLKAALQAALDGQSRETERVVLGFGLCSKAVLGLRAERCRLVVPKVDDCVGLFLGSRDRHRHEAGLEPGTYYLTRGWIEAGITLLDEAAEMEKRHGKKKTEMILRAMLKNYTRLAYINTGLGEQEAYRRYARRAAARLKLRYEEIQGDPGLLEKMILGPHDNGFIVVPPGQAIGLHHFD